MKRDDCWFLKKKEVGTYLDFYREIAGDRVIRPPFGATYKPVSRWRKSANDGSKASCALPHPGREVWCLSVSTE